MFKLRLADYINSNMRQRALSYKDLAALSGVPDSSLHSYAQARVSNPNEDNLVRIAAAFGDGPEVIQRMRHESLTSTTQENQIMARVDDKDQAEELAALIRSSMAALLEEYREQFARQQTEIIQHADRRVSSERAQLERQCAEEIAKIKAHTAEMMRVEKEHQAELRERNEATRAYLKTLVHNLSAALITVSIIAALVICLIGSYALYAYHTFDRADPARGLYQPGESTGIGLLIAAVLLIGAAAYKLGCLYMSKKE